MYILYIHIYTYIWSVCFVIELINTWASLDGIDRVALPHPNAIHVQSVCVMSKCYHAIPNDSATIINECAAPNDVSGSHS